MKFCNDYISYKDIVSHLDIDEGDIILVSSDILKLLCVCRDNNESFDPNTFIDSFIEKIGKKGTLLFQTFNWGFCEGSTFDYQNTFSETGALGKVALNRQDFKRTKHPIYSFVVWGNDQKHLCKLNNISAFGADSPFAYMYERCAKNLFMYKTIEFSGFSFVHYIEEKVGVDYRYHKDFTAPYIDENGKENDLTYRMYVRDLSLNVVTGISPQLDDILVSKGYYSKYLINGIDFGLIDLRGAGDIMEHDLRTKGGLLYPKTIR